MCKYCEDPREAIKDDEKNYNVMIWLSEETEVRYYDDGYGWQSVMVPFKFCPICARRLKAVSNGGD